MRFTSSSVSMKLTGHQTWSHSRMHQPQADGVQPQSGYYGLATVAVHLPLSWCEARHQHL